MIITKVNMKDVYKAKLCSVETMELKGYKLIKELFVDSSGFGQDDELALTPNQFERELTAILSEYGAVTAKITDAGQFQVYVGLFTKTGKKITKKIGNNTLFVDYGDRTAIRLHNTDVVTFKDDKIILNTGGWNTRTTTARMSEHLPNGYVYRKNWELYANYRGIEYKFEGDTLELTA